MASLIIHGRQPAIGRAELESLYGAEVIAPVGDKATLVNLKPPDIYFANLGGMVKFCKVLTELETTDWNKVRRFLEVSIPKHLSSLSEGKLRLGLSTYGMAVSARKLHASGLEIKKMIKQAGFSCRIVPNNSPDLSSAQVLHNKLTSANGWEIVLVRNGNKTIVAQSIAVQDIDSYASRDRNRPFRDSKVGMLPPKLAQTIVNLARGKDLGLEKTTLLDPFCGTGVLLQESLLMGLEVYGTDIDERMVDYTKNNLGWLVNSSIGKKLSLHRPISLAVMDATKGVWPKPFQVIASETYLGRPFAKRPDKSTLGKVIHDCGTIHEKFLKNMATQIDSGFRLCLAVPAWRVDDDFQHLPTLDHLERLGYNRLSFQHATSRDLIYFRPNQHVARELVVLQKK